MAINDNSTLVVKTGRFYTAPVGTAAPTDLKKLDKAWVEMGHTSLDDILAWATEGGEPTTLGSLQSPSLRTSSSARTESFTTALLQWDAATLPFYFGSDMALIPGSEVFMGVKSRPTSIRKAFLVVFEDGENRFAVYAPSAEIARGDDLSIDSTEELASLPIKITLQNYEGNDWAFAITPIGGAKPSGSAGSTRPSGGASGDNTRTA